MEPPPIDPADFDLSRIVMTKEQVYRILPHTHEFQLVDGVFLLDVEKKIVIGFHDARPDEFWTKGHFPGNPVFPGVMLVEFAAHVAVMAYKHVIPEVKNKMVYFGGVDNTRFRGMVKPGDRVVVAAALGQSTPRACKARCWGYVKNQRAYECDILGLPLR